MKRRLGFCLAAVVVFLAPGRLCHAASSQELITEAKLFDGAHVLYGGEIIGEVLRRGDHAWINVYDGDNAVGVWVPAALTEKIKHAGSYKCSGDRIRVHGIFHRACPEHGGALDIHAQDLLVVEPGRQVLEELDSRKILVLAVLLGVLICLLMVRIFLKKRARK
ncbi:MAG: DNA-binding protein [Candidatus Velamenicoccus archaeovorus]